MTAPQSPSDSRAVKRWRCTTDAGDSPILEGPMRDDEYSTTEVLRPREAGDVVLASDFDALAAQVAQLRDTLRIVQETSIEYARKMNAQVAQLEADLTRFVKANAECADVISKLSTALAERDAMREALEKIVNADVHEGVSRIANDALAPQAPKGET